MVHDSSVVIQVELETDVESMEQGIQNAFLFEPEVAYIADIWDTDPAPSLSQLLNEARCTILSTAGHSPAKLLERLQQATPISWGADSQQGRIIAKVLPAEGNRIEIEFFERLTGTAAIG
jgi:hypothetical protein